MSPLYYALGAKSTAALPPAFRLQNILEQLGEWVPNGWFIFIILLFEFSFYIMARLFKQDTRKIIIGCIVIVGGCIACMRILHMGYWWYYRSHCFLMGMIWCEEEERLINMFRKHFRLWWTGIFSGVFVLSMCYFFQKQAILW